eukprot:365718-Chlamydomonas_euryale.AAC.30
MPPAWNKQLCRHGMPNAPSAALTRLQMQHCNMTYVNRTAGGLTVAQHGAWQWAAHSGLRAHSGLASWSFDTMSAIAFDVAVR